VNDQPSPSTPQATALSSQPPKKTSLAVASLVLGIFGPSFLAISMLLLWAFDAAGGIRPVGLTFAIAAFVVWVILTGVAPTLGIVFGVVALKRISKSSGRITGRGQAIAGLVTGTASLLLYAAMILPALAGAREKDRRSQCLSNMKQISVAIDIYAKEHDGNIPRTFDDLRPYATNLDKLLICPSAKDRNHPSYQIVLGGGKWQGDNPDAIVVTESAADHRFGSHVLLDDGHVEYRPNELDPLKPN